MLRDCREVGRGGSGATTSHEHTTHITTTTPTYRPARLYTAACWALNSAPVGAWLLLLLAALPAEAPIVGSAGRGVSALPLLVAAPFSPLLLACFDDADDAEAEEDEAEEEEEEEEEPPAAAAPAAPPLLLPPEATASRVVAAPRPPIPPPAPTASPGATPSRACLRGLMWMVVLPELVPSSAASGSVKVCRGGSGGKASASTVMSKSLSSSASSTSSSLSSLSSRRRLRRARVLRRRGRDPSLSPSLCETRRSFWVRAS